MHSREVIRMVTIRSRNGFRPAAALALAALVFCAAPASAEMSQEELAKMAQNPIADLISVPFQNDTNFNVGPYNRTQDILNIQPVIPVHLNPEWNLITRTIVPLIWQPGMAPGQNTTFGLGDIQLTAFLSPAKPGGMIWGVGPIFQLPTHTDDLGTRKWGIGPSVVGLKIEKHWVYGALVNQVWSFAGPDGAPAINQFLMQPFVNYNFKEGFYVTSGPIITANWKASSSNTWTVPLGGGAGKIFKIGGKLPLNVQGQAFYNIVSPDMGPDWSIRLQAQILFPE
jgi:hypothetical protein